VLQKGFEPLSLIQREDFKSSVYACSTTGAWSIVSL
jgi:hypothetical protein